jgi:ArsR family transcriptional regulator
MFLQTPPPLISSKHLVKIQSVINKRITVKRSTSKKTPNPRLSNQRKAEIFKALGHPTRLQIVEKLADGEECVCILLEMFNVDVSTLSRHLSVLKNAGILSDERRGKNIFYSLTCPCIVNMFECLEKTLIKR